MFLADSRRTIGNFFLYFLFPNVFKNNPKIIKQWHSKLKIKFQSSRRGDNPCDAVKQAHQKYTPKKKRYKKTSQDNYSSDAVVDLLLSTIQETNF
ncbi:hypothetical protein BpHYR1_029580 [Brachionus plicatilis]|uniref:Uncharacterized protein n=1 Tax=Brachionus plicatilis TaxID=10195 RepID=A0A3M7Q7R5_BRAPC|nr:hypothetical protein BpHYR1_029580 [Brachionus plicatilis]